MLQGTLFIALDVFFIIHQCYNHRDFVSEVMHDEDPEGFDLRQPYAKKVLRTLKHYIGINERWCADGHDKVKILGSGYPIYGFVDDATSKFLAIYIVPDNRTNAVTSYCFLDVVEKAGGSSM